MTMVISNDSILRRSGQTWKYFTWLVAFLASGIVVLVSARLEHVEVAFGAMFVCAASLVAGWATIRCRKCGARWLWMAMRTQGIGSWARWLSAQKVCPRCGDK